MVVTGLGMVSPLGNTVEDTWQALIAGESGADRITQFDPDGFPVDFACEVKDLDVTDYIEYKASRRMDRFTHLALAAARQAEADAGLDIAADPDRVGAAVATGIGGLKSFEACIQVLDTRGPDRVNPFSIVQIIPNLAAGWVSMELGTKGPLLSECTACAASNMAIGDGLDAIRLGRALERQGGRWLETPTKPEDVAGNAEIARALDMAIALGECERTRWQFRPILEARAADVIQPDVGRAGGISETMRIAAQAETYNVPVALHQGVGFGPYIAATLQVKGVDATAMPVSEVKDAAGYDGYVIGSAVYALHWLGDAKQFVHRNRELLRRHPVWLFSSGPLSTDDDDRREAAPRDIADLAAEVDARGHLVFGVLRLMVRQAVPSLVRARTGFRWGRENLAFCMPSR